MVDLGDAIAAHVRWKIRLLQCINGQAEFPKTQDLERDDACELGKWLAGGGIQYAKCASFSDTKAAHTAFHLRAAEVVRALEIGDRRKAEAMMRTDGEFSVASEAVVFALAKLRGEVRKAGAVPENG